MEIQEKFDLTRLIKEKALEEGFLDCGISRAGFLEEEKDRLINWLEKGHHGEMSYMQKNVDKRLDPRKLVDNAKSVISVLLNYYPATDFVSGKNYRLSKYAYGRDYHKVIRKKLRPIVNLLEEKGKSRGTRAFTDSAPVLDRAWARKAGLGWIGKNTCLINVRHGSFFFIGEVITDVELAYDEPFEKDFCGGCTRCIDACPTGALIAPQTLDSRRCISYLTIEHKSGLPDNIREQFGNWIFGCDICQDVCPWNRVSKPHREPLFEPKKTLTQMTREKWEMLTEDEFDELFEGSAVKRTKYYGLKRNINFVKKINSH